MIISGIDDWLLKWADNNYECEPDSFKCIGCKETECYFWDDYNELESEEEGE